MPFFEKANILLIHIPKTGGTSLEDYFYSKFNIKKTLSTLWSNPTILLNSHTLQHCTYIELYERKEYFNIDFDNVKIIASVRNPYYRIISDLFFNGMIQKDTDQNIVFEKIKEFIKNPSKFDYHPRPQYEYLVDNLQNINEKIHIIKNENLTDSMKKLGYDDFDIWKNCSYKNNFDYTTLLNDDSIKLLNEFYSKDFELFGYEKIVR
jgi:hypothetical protein